MAKDESRKEQLADLLRTNKVKFRPIAANMHEIADPDESEAFLFDVHPRPGEATSVVVSIDSNNNLNVFFDTAAHESAKFTKLLPQLTRFAVLNDLKFNGEDLERVDSYMKKRKKQMKDDNTVLQEGYHALSSQRSWGDHVPQVKIVIEHNRKLSEGEQRFRSINRIFIENTVGERILTPVRETSLAKPFARLIAEGDLPHGQRWQHVEQLVEEYQKIRGFVRATKDQVNEHVLVKVGRGHFQTLRETLQKLSGHRGYNTYFESWQPTLTEDNSTPDLSTLVESGEDPRIVEALPILYRLQRSQSSQPVVESRELQSLESWADSVIYDKILEDDSLEEMNRRGFLRTGAGLAALGGLAAAAKYLDTDTQRILDADAEYKKHKAAYEAAKAAGNRSAMEMHAKEMEKIIARHKADKGRAVDEDLDADQKRAGQLGPTEKVGPKGPVGKLVGASESVHSAPALNIKESTEVDDILQLAKLLNR